MSNHESTARMLCNRLNNPDGFAYYCKVALKLSEAEIWSLYEDVVNDLALENPSKVFTSRANRKMREKQ